MKNVYKFIKEEKKMLSQIFEFVMGILGSAGAGPEAQSIVQQVFDFVLSFFAK